MVSITYCVVFVVVVYLRLVYSGVHHIVSCLLLLFIFILCMMVSNTYCVVFVVVYLRLVNSGVQHILCRVCCCCLSSSCV